MGESEEAIGALGLDDGNWMWKQLSPRHLEHRPCLPTAITLHRLVPRPSYHSTRDKASIAHFRHFKQEEFEEAQTRARHDLLIARLKQPEAAKPTSSDQAVVESLQPKQSQVKQFDSKKQNRRPQQGQNSDSVLLSHVKKKATTNGKISGRVKTRPHASTRQGIGEENLRLRQLTRFVNDITASLSELGNSFKQDYPEKEFISPQENYIKQRRWEEFLRSAGRSLFSLKHEISVLERTTRQEDRKKSKYLRTLAVATRTLLRLLLALQSQTDKTFATEIQKKLFHELVILTYKLFPLVSSVGVCIPKLRVKNFDPLCDAHDEKSNGGYSNELAENFDPTSWTNISQSYIRERIAFVADQHLRRKRKRKGDKSSRGKNGLPVKGSLKDELMNISPKDNKRSLEIDTKDEQCKLSSDENGSDQTSEAQLKVIDGEELVQNTAEAVVERLREFIEIDRKKSTSEIAEEDTGQQITRENKQSISDLTQRIIFLLQRVCKIEEDQRETEAFVNDVLPKSNKESPNNLPTAIKRAQEMMAGLTTDDHQHLSLPKTFISDSSSGIGLTLSKINRMSLPNPQQSEQVKVQSNIADNLFRGDQEYTKNIEWTTRQYMANAETVAAQVQRQKEEFWASLVERGYLHPQVITGRGSQEVLNVVDGMTTRDNDVKSGMDALVNFKREDFNIKKDYYRATRKMQNSPRNQQKENKETQISLSLLSPDQSSQFSESGDIENTATTSSKQTGVDEIIVSNERNLPQSSIPADSSKSSSFPSYSGVTES